MKDQTTSAITIETTVNAPIEKVWKTWAEPEHITKWCQASDDWHAPNSENDLRTGGKFKTTMAAKDGSFSFDFGGTYTDVVDHKKIAYSLDDNRKVVIHFSSEGNTTKIVETFDPESVNSIDMQRDGWQAILNNFKKYTESI